MTNYSLVLILKNISVKNKRTNSYFKHDKMENCV